MRFQAPAMLRCRANACQRGFPTIRSMPPPASNMTGKLRLMNSARQVRSHLLVPIANKFGYEAAEIISRISLRRSRSTQDAIMTLIRLYKSFESIMIQISSALMNAYPFSIQITMTIRGKVSGHSCLAMCSAPISQAASYKGSYL